MLVRGLPCSPDRIPCYVEKIPCPCVWRIADSGEISNSTRTGSLAGARRRRSGGAREHQVCPDQAEHVVGAVLDQRGARIAEDFFDRILLAEAVATQQLKRVAGHL